MSITNNCMIVNLQIGTWAGYRLDKEASRAVTETAHAADDAARVNKHLVSKDVLKPIVSASNAVRSHFYEKTLPWKDNGDRLLTRALFTKFMDEHARLVDKFKEAVEDFVGRTYLTAREQAEFRMGTMFKPDDYPHPDDLRRRFYVNLDIDAVTEANDFRVQLDNAEMAHVRSSMEQALKQRMGTAMRDVWDRIATTLGHFANKMGSDEVFREATVTNLQDIVDLLPGLNILNDPDLEAIRLRIEQNLTGYDAKLLRSNKSVRDIAATEAKRIMDDMAGFMNAFGGQK